MPKSSPAGKRAPARPGTLAVETADRVHSAAIHLLRRVRREDDASGIPAPRWSALSVVVFRGPITISELARAEQVRPPTITRVVAALEEAGLVERIRETSDRRVVRVRATDKGRELMEEGRRRRVSVLAQDFAALAEAELALVSRAVAVLERVVGPRHWPLQGGKRR